MPKRDRSASVSSTSSSSSGSSSSSSSGSSVSSASDGRGGRDNEHTSARRKMDPRTIHDKEDAKSTAEDGAATIKKDPRLLMGVDTGRAGGVYIPPFKLAQLRKQVTDKTSKEYQRMTWDALRKSINGLINKVRCQRELQLPCDETDPARHR